jgi:hypothetical protein
MPYLNSKLEPSKHKKNCVNPVAKRLYIRDYDYKGNQKFVSWGLTCTTCGIVIKQNYEHNFTKGKRITYHDKGPLEFDRERKFQNKIEGLKQKKPRPDRMSPTESGLRKRIGRLKQFYELMSLHWGDLDIAWEDELVEDFLNVSPRPTIKELQEIFQPTWSKVNIGSRRWRKYIGYVDDPDKQGWLKYDREKYKDLLESEAHKRQDMMRQIIKSREGKKK